MRKSRNSWLIMMKKTFEGWLFNRMETLGGREYNHVGCEGDDREFGEFLAQFVPEVGMRRRVMFTIKTMEDDKDVEDR